MRKAKRFFRLWEKMKDIWHLLNFSGSKAAVNGVEEGLEERWPPWIPILNILTLFFFCCCCCFFFFFTISFLQRTLASLYDFCTPFYPHNNLWGKLGMVIARDQTQILVSPLQVHYIMLSLPIQCSINISTIASVLVPVSLELQVFKGILLPIPIFFWLIQK